MRHGGRVTARTAASPLLAYAAACLGIALYAVMDAAMKTLALAMGAYPALFWRIGVTALVAALVHAARRPGWPPAAVLRVHAARAGVVTVMALAFFWGIARVPLAVAVGLSFIAPLIALALAALFLGERVGARSLIGSALAVGGVGAILAGRLGGGGNNGEGGGEAALLGMAAVLLSAVFYAVNLVMARHQARRSGAWEIASFQTGMVFALLALAAPWWLVVPPIALWPTIVAAAALALTSLLLLSWANARAPARLLISSEYTAFIWSALMGWTVFGERLSWATLGGTVLIVIGCLTALRDKAPAAEPGV